PQRAASASSRPGPARRRARSWRRHLLPSGSPSSCSCGRSWCGALAQSPGDLHPETVQQLLRAPLPLHVKYREIDAQGILHANMQGQPPACLRTISTALNILEKYGRNLLNPPETPLLARGQVQQPRLPQHGRRHPGRAGRAPALWLHGAAVGRAELRRGAGGAGRPACGLCHRGRGPAAGRAQPAALEQSPEPRILQGMLQGGQEVTLILDSVPIHDTAPPGALPQTGAARPPPATCLLCGLEPASPALPRMQPEPLPLNVTVSSTSTQPGPSTGACPWGSQAWGAGPPAQ
ncbi:unnamed protein product, partial [Lepidochelys kempii]